MPALSANSIKERLLNDSIPIPESGCWIWMGAITKTGYGIIVNRFTNRKPKWTHRLSYETFCNPIPKGLHVLHRCDIPSCINPKHLFIGTPLDNQRDCIRKGRRVNHQALKTHCKRGHEFTKENTYIDIKANQRSCRACKSIRDKIYWKKYHKH